MTKTKFPWGILTGALLMVATAIPSHAQGLKESDIVSKLGVKAPLTRSLTGPKKFSAEEEAFIKRMGTRGIKIKPAEKKQLDEIIAKHDLPKIDFEINFEFDSARIKQSSIPELIELSKALKNPKLGEAKVMLIGHTDAKGSNSYNQDLSERRAHSVASFLQDLGIKSGRLVPLGFGEDRLKNPNDPEAGENRRVEVVNVTQG